MDRFIEGVGELLTHNLPTKLISILIAVILWVVVLGSRNVEVSKDVPVEVLTSPEVVVSNEVPDKVSFRLSGPKAFLRAVLDRREDPVRINLVGSKPGLVTYRFFSDNIRLPIGVRVLAVTPSSVMIKLEATKSKTLPIRVVTTGELPEGLKLKSIELLPESVLVSGPDSRVDALTQIPTVPIDLGALTGSEEREVSLDVLGAGVIPAGPKPRVRISVEGHGANFKIRNLSIRVKTSLQYSVEPTTITALVRASPADLRKLDRSKVFGRINAEGRTKGVYNEPVDVALPSNITLVRVIPETVKLTLY